MGMVFQTPNPFPTMSVYENVAAGLTLNRRGISRAEKDEIVEGSLRGAHLWEEVKDRLNRKGSGSLRWPAAAALHRPRDRGRTGGAADGRALLGPGSGRHPRGGGSDQGSEAALHDRDRDPQHAAGGAHQRRDCLLQSRGRPASPAVWSRWTPPTRSSRRRPRRRRRTTSAGGSADARGKTPLPGPPRRARDRTPSVDWTWWLPRSIARWRPSNTRTWSWRSW